MVVQRRHRDIIQVDVINSTRAESRVSKNTPAITVDNRGQAANRAAHLGFSKDRIVQLTLESRLTSAKTMRVAYSFAILHDT